MASVQSLTNEQRKALSGLQAIMRSEMVDIWDRLDSSDVKKLLPVLDEVLGELYAKYGPAAGSLGADFYESLRELAGAGGRFTPIMAVLSEQESEGRFNTVSGTSVGALFGASPDRNAAFTNLFGGLQLAVLDVHRNTVTNASLSDAASRGWQRVGVGDNCPFCNMLIARGGVYKKSTVNFGAHPTCNCQSVPTFHGTPNYYKSSDVAAYRKSARRIRPADRARVQRWMQENGY